MYMNVFVNNVLKLKKCYHIGLVSLFLYPNDIIILADTAYFFKILLKACRYNKKRLVKHKMMVLDNSNISLKTKHLGKNGKPTIYFINIVLEINIKTIISFKNFMGQK